MFMVFLLFMTGERQTAVSRPDWTETKGVPERGLLNFNEDALFDVLGPV